MGDSDDDDLSIMSVASHDSRGRPTHSFLSSSDDETGKASHKNDKSKKEEEKKVKRKNILGYEPTASLPQLHRIVPTIDNKWRRSQIDDNVVLPWKRTKEVKKARSVDDSLNKVRPKSLVGRGKGYKVRKRSLIEKRNDFSLLAQQRRQERQQRKRPGTFTKTSKEHRKKDRSKEKDSGKAKAKPKEKSRSSDSRSDSKKTTTSTTSTPRTTRTTTSNTPTTRKTTSTSKTTPTSTTSSRTSRTVRPLPVVPIIVGGEMDGDFDDGAQEGQRSIGEDESGSNEQKENIYEEPNVTKLASSEINSSLSRNVYLNTSTSASNTWNLDLWTLSQNGVGNENELNLSNGDKRRGVHPSRTNLLNNDNNNNHNYDDNNESSNKGMLGVPIVPEATIYVPPSSEESKDPREVDKGGKRDEDDDDICDCFCFCCLVKFQKPK